MAGEMGDRSGILGHKFAYTWIRWVLSAHLIQEYANLCPIELNP